MKQMQTRLAVGASLLLLCCFAGCKESGPPKKCKQATPQLVFNAKKEQVKQGNEWLCWSNGAWRSIKTWKKGALHGLFMEGYPNGTRKLFGRFYQGKKAGKWTYRFANGKISKIEHFQKGKLHGDSMHWYPNGKKKQAGRYQSGRKEGKWTGWFRTGQKIGDVNYTNGTLARAKKLPKKLLHTLRSKDSFVKGAFFTSNDKVLISLGIQLRYWDLTTGKLTKSHKLNSTGTGCMSASKDHKFLAVGFDSYGERDRNGIVRSINPPIEVVQLTTGKQMLKLKGHTHHVRSVEFSPDRRLLASSSARGKVFIWELKTGKLVKKLTRHSGDVRSVAFHPKGKILATSSDDKSIILWDTSSWKVIRTLAPGISPKVGKPCKYDFSCKKGMCYRRRCRTRDPARGHTRILANVAFHPEGKLLVSAEQYKPGLVIFWDVKTGEKLRSFQTEGIKQVLFHPDGKTLVLITSKGIAFRDIVSGSTLHTLKGASGRVAFNSDGTLLAASAYMKVLVWKAP